MREYLLRLTACAFLVTLAASVVTQPRLCRIVKLLGGCLLALTALQPLVGLDLNALPDVLYPYGLSEQNAIDDAQRKNAALLESMIREQTEQTIRTRLKAEGIEASFHLTLQMDASVGAPVPWAILIKTACSEAQKQSFSVWLSQELGIPAERQQWRAP